MNDIAGAGRPSNFGKDQRIYTWNGILRCVHCHKITQKGECANGCDIFVGTWGQAQSGDTNTARFEALLEAEALAVQEGALVCSRCDSVLERGVAYSIEHSAFGETTVYCNTCTDVWVDEKIDQGLLLEAEDGSWFDPQLFPNKAVKDCLRCGAYIPVARVVSKCDNCLEQVDQPAFENDPGYLAIEEAITRGEAFQCAYCGITDDISQLDDGRAGLNRCQTCQAKHEGAAYDPS